MVGPLIARRNAAAVAFRLSLCVGAAGCGVIATGAQAQNTGIAAVPPLLAKQPVPNEDRLGVQERPRPEFQSDGFQVGAFQIRPTLEADLGYAGNVFATSGNQVSDGVYVIVPTVDVQSNWNRHALRLRGTGQIYDYFSTRNASENEYAFSADGRIDVRGASAIELGGAYSHEIERRDSGSFPTGRVAPVAFDRGTAYLRGSYSTGQWRLIGQTDVTVFRFEDARALDLDNRVVQTFDQHDRDRTILRAGGRVEYSPTGSYSLFVAANWGHYAYDRKTLVNTTVPNRDGQQIEATAGIAWTRTLLRGSVAVGYVRRSYDASHYRDISGVSLHADVTYLMTPVLTLTATADRQVEDTAIVNAPGYIATRMSLTADYEARRNLIFSLLGGYRINDFKGIERLDHVANGRFQTRYLANRRIEFRGTVTLIRRTSNFGISVPNYTDTRGTLGAIYKF